MKVLENISTQGWTKISRPLLVRELTGLYTTLTHAVDMICLVGETEKYQNSEKKH